MNAASMVTSSAMIARARPPWLRTITGKSSSPRHTISPIRPLTPVSQRVTTPFWM